MNEPTDQRSDAATNVFNLPRYRVTAAEVLAFGQRRIRVESVLEAGCRSCGVISSRRHSKRFQRIRYILIAGPVEAIWTKLRFFCGEPQCGRKTFAEATPQVPAFSRSTSRLRESLVDAVIGSGRAATETATAFGMSWWLVQRALDAAALKLPCVDLLARRGWALMSTGSAPYVSSRTRRPRRGSGSSPGCPRSWIWIPGRVLGVVDGGRQYRSGTSSKPGHFSGASGCRWWRSTHRRRCGCGCHGPLSASMRSFGDAWKCDGDRGPSAQRLTQETKGSRGRAADPVWANRRLLLKGEDRLSDRARNRLEVVFAVDAPTGRLQADWEVKEQLRTLLGGGSIEAAAAAKPRLQELVERTEQSEARRLYRTVCRWWNEIEVLIITRATTAKVEANNMSIETSRGPAGDS
ncbi:transposase [Arthrobacter sp. Soil782]|uniref:transposase n=1 Tax=Arthrobacter sp. Soil782 TaxID=1736410 RepID=UPI000A645871|nr:transposase [Arthrobacter sp. Soil782]